ncbi:hypothetical protein ACFFGV_13090 [Pontibacillus salicampi]|uniref:DUF4025 domain-containing protein n=1 Tax=Pontibacillus salicampi TaxID=1449801 RepID=A0ABV6LQG2_9BACI
MNNNKKGTGYEAVDEQKFQKEAPTYNHAKKYGEDATKEEVEQGETPEVTRAVNVYDPL